MDPGYCWAIALHHPIPLSRDFIRPLPGLLFSLHFCFIFLEKMELLEKAHDVSLASPTNTAH